MELVKAKESDLDFVRKTYRSVQGTEFCPWNEYYPSETEISADMAAKTLFILRDGEKRLGAISVVPENELDAFGCFKVKENAKEIARICIAPEYQGRGYAAKMVGLMINKLKEEGVAAVRISVYVKNVPAEKTYKKLGFDFLMKTELYGAEYYICEKVL